MLLHTRSRHWYLPLHNAQEHHQLYRVRKTSLLSKRRITGQIRSMNQRRGLHFLSVQLPPQQHLPKRTKALLSAFGSCLEQLMEGKKMCYFTALQKFNTLISHVIAKEGDTSFDIILNSMTVCLSGHELQ